MSKRTRTPRTNRPRLLEMLDHRIFLAGDTLASVSFQEAVLANLGPTNDVDLADLDGDGDLDAFFAIDNNQGDRVWFNDGHGQFIDSGQSLGNSSSIYAALGDVDGDRDMDALVATRAGNRVWLNDGQGRFSDSGQVLGQQLSIDVALGDLDGDGDLDAFVANNRGQGNTVWLNDGRGSFADSGQLLGTHDSKSVELGDLDGDGDLDAMVGNAGTTGEPNTVWLNNGLGQFRDSGQTLGVSQTQHAALGDLDGDGDLDTFFANSGTAADEVWINNGAGLFTNSLQSLGDFSGSHVVLADFNDDNTLDAMVANWWDQPHDLWLNDGTGQFEASGLNFGGLVSSHIAVGDLDADGDLDAVVANYGGPITMYRNQAQPYDTDPSPNRVWEFSPNGLPVGLDLNVANATEVVYALEQDGDGRFRIDATTGVVTIADGSRLNHNEAARHTVRVRATFADGSFQSRSFSIDVARLGIPLVTPVASNDLTDRVHIQWEPAAGATAYEVWRSSTPEVTAAHLLATVAGTTSYDDIGTAPRAQHYYWLRPVAAEQQGTFGPSTVGWRATNRPEVGLISPTLLLYDAQTGTLTFESEAPLQTLIIRSRSGLFTGGAPDRVEVRNQAGFRYASLGALPAGLSQATLAADLEFGASLSEGGQLPDLHLVYLEDATRDALVVYHEPSGNLAVDGRARITTLEITSSTPIFGGTKPSVITPPFDVFIPTKIFVLATAGYDNVDFGQVVTKNLSFADIQAQWRLAGSKAPSGPLTFSLVYVSSLTQLLANQAPVAMPDQVSLLASREPQTIASQLLTANDLDADGDQLVVSTVDGRSLQGANVRVDEQGQVVYDAAGSDIVRSLPEGLTIRDDFSYQITDGRGGYATSRVTVRVTGVNDPPVAQDDTLTLGENGPRVEITSLLLANDRDEDFGDELRVASLDTNSLRGTITQEADGSLWYAPGPGFDTLLVGELANDSLTYHVVDRFGATAVGHLSITIVGDSDTPGDLNGDTRIDTLDIDLMCAEISSGTDRARFDLDGNGTIGLGDMDHLITKILNTVYGDVNLDGLFDTTDLVLVFQAGQYNDLIENNSTWISGDWNCDREFDSSDLILAFQSGRFEA